MVLGLDHLENHSGFISSNHQLPYLGSCNFLPAPGWFTTTVPHSF